MTTAAPTFGYAISLVPDIEAAKRFYVEALGFQVAVDNPHFVQFTSPAGASFAIAPLGDSMDGSGQTELWWLVDDADRAFQELSPQAEVSLPPRDMPFGRCFGLKDPTGQPRYFLQPPARGF